ncbi:MAG: methionine biosynthesis PLP-dependent protein [Bacillaceae bacterium]
MKGHHLETTLAQLGNRSETLTGAVSAPLYLSTAYRHEGIGMSTGFDYSRTGNPTRKVVEEAIATLEHGHSGFAFSSGMAAIHTLMLLFQSGDEIFVSKDLYGGTYRLFETGMKNFGLHFSYFTFFDLEEVEQRITKQTKAFFIETPTNPLMQEVDLEKISQLAKKYNLLLIVDNTFYTPILQQPLLLGADIVLHSATKYLGGHNDVLAGLIVAKDSAICEQIFKFQNGAGAVLSPFDSWLLLRGMKTLSLRMKQHEKNAKDMATFLSNHDDVTEVLYPGKGGMLSFRIQDEKYINSFLQNLQLITFAESLGGCESFITYPATQTHMDIPEEIRIENGICNRLLRFSVGIENSEDLIHDLNNAFIQMKGSIHI